MNRALPGPVIDLIRDGVPELEVKRRGADRAIRAALIRTAASAHQRGWTRVEWTDLVDQRANLLSRQVHVQANGTEYTARHVERAYRTAWEEAARWVTEDAAPAFDRASALARVEDLTAAAATADMSARDRAVLDYAHLFALSVGTDRPALPRHAVVAHTGLGEKAVRLALASLVQLGWLHLEVPGRRGTVLRRASLYRLTLPPGAAIPAEGERRTTPRPTPITTPTALPSNVTPLHRRTA